MGSLSSLLNKEVQETHRLFDLFVNFINREKQHAYSTFFSMNSAVEPNPQPPPASSSPDEVASSLDKISISSNNNAETLSPEDFINKLHSQKAAMLKIIDSINDQNIQFVMQNNFEGLESNDKKLSFATKSLERFDKLIADQVNIISLN